VTQLPEAILKKLKLNEAAEQEAAAWRNLVPPEPWQSVLAAKPGPFAGWVKTRLASGARNAPAIVTNARKTHQGIRPVPVIGIAERIAFRALTNWVLSELPTIDRSAAAYREFVGGPIQAAFKGKTRFRVSDASVDYVIQADIAAFYQYVDHGILSNELEMQTGEIEGSRALIALLGEIQGKEFGLPQLLDASDELSDLYVSILHRHLARLGLKLWRYNDDFRFTADGYDDAQQIIEDVSAGAHEIGLVLNEGKTHISKFNTYFWKYFLEDDMGVEEEFKPEDMEIFGDYGILEEEEAISSARETIARLELAEGDRKRLNIRKLEPAGARDLRRALNSVVRTGDDAALGHAAEIFEFAPEFTPRVCEYLKALNDGGTDIGSVWDQIVSRTEAFNVWQRVWLTYLARTCELMVNEDRRSWVERQRNWKQPGLLHAECCLALSNVGGVTFSELDQALRVMPEPLAPWYVLAIRNLQDVTKAELDAVKGSSPMFRLLLED
jgi:hypothetical protein